MRGSGAWIPRRLVRAEEKHRAVVIKNVLRTVSVVDVPIGDQNPLDAVLALGVAGRDGDIIENTKTHPLIRTGVMARWTHGSERVDGFLLEHRIHGIHQPACGTKRHIPRFRTDGRVSGAE